MGLRLDYHGPGVDTLVPLLVLSPFLIGSITPTMYAKLLLVMGEVVIVSHGHNSWLYFLYYEIFQKKKRTLFKVLVLKIS